MRCLADNCLPGRDSDPQIHLYKVLSCLWDSDSAFDLVFLGIGSDGHTASLFPDQPETDAATGWVLAVKGGNPNVDRITLSYPVLNRARKIVFLVAGASKAEIVRTVLTGSDQRLPVQRIRPPGIKPLWLLDTAAARLLPKSIGSP